MISKNQFVYKKMLSRVIYWSGLNYLLRKIGRKGALIITYHRIVEDKTLFDYVTKKEFEKQMAYLARHYNVVSLEDYAKGARNAVIVTVDDGYKDFYDNAYPVLKKLNIPATIFVSTKNVDTKNMFWWDKIEQAAMLTGIKQFKTEEGLVGLDRIFDYLKSKDNKYREAYVKKLVTDSRISLGKQRIYLSWAELVQLVKSNISIGGHTANHTFLGKLSYKEQKKEIKDNIDRLNKKLQINAKTFGYPYGSYNEDSLKIMRELKLHFACTGIQGLNKNPSNEYELKRISISRDDDITIFKVKMTGVFEFLKSILK